MRLSLFVCSLVCAAGMRQGAPVARPALGRREGRPSVLDLRGGAQPASLRLHAAVAKPPSPVVTAVTEWWATNSVILLSTVASLVLISPALKQLPFKAAFTAGVLVVVLIQMAFDGKPEQILLEAAVALIAANVITLKDALAGFSSEGVVSVGVMCAVAKGVATTGGLELLAKVLLGSPSSYTVALLRMVCATMAVSAFMNNTPVCAMMMPILAQWTASLGLPASGMLMPLSFATMLGGTITLIGSSTNLVARTAALKQDPTFSMGVFDITTVGLINAAAGTAYMALFAPKLLPGAGTPVQKLAGTDTKSGKTVAPRGQFRLWLALALLTGTMTIAAKEPKALLLVALGCLCVMLRTGCLGLKDAWSAINGPVLLSIALSFALGSAIEKSELASIVAARLVQLVVPYGQLALLAAIYFVAICVGAIISNNAVVVLMFPIVVRICEQAGISWKPALYALTMAASASYSTPVSYQTNLMVAGAANYSFNDFLKFGIPLQLVCMLATVPACYFLIK